MISTQSWVWYTPAQWPGFWSWNQNNIGNNGNNLTIDPQGYRDITWNDANGDGAIFDADTGDGSSANGDSVTIAGFGTKTVHEVGVYNDSTVVIAGQTYTVPVVVWVFTDGTYATRLNDDDIPANRHFSQVESIKLGRWDRTEYAGTYIETRDDPFVCFTAGTLIHVPGGQRRVEDLRPGDPVMTADHGMQPLRWIGQRTVAGQGAAAPVWIAEGALGNSRDLCVSQQHRMLLGGWRSELIAGASEVLVAARHLVNDDTIRLRPCASVTYVHLLFDRHEIVFAEGIPSESFHPAAWGLGVLDRAARDEVLMLFPELARDPAGFGETARPCLRGWQAKALLAA